MTKGFIDLHCHYVPAVDDGVRTQEESRNLLKALRRAGFSKAIATPHIRTAMFENSPGPLRETFEELRGYLAGEQVDVPKLAMAAEHYFDDVFWNRFNRGEVCTYPGGNAILVEFSRRQLPMMIEKLIAKMCQEGIRPVIAHPERYQPVWANPECLRPLMKAGAVLLLDTMSVVGEYGKQSALAAERLLSLGWYSAACSDSHRPAHVENFEKAVRVLAETRGETCVQQLLHEGPTLILEGAVPSFVGFA